MRHTAPFRRLALASTALALVAGLPADPLIAAACTWNGGGGDWSNGALWSCGAVPGAGDTVRIDANPGIASTVAITSGQSAGTLTLDGGDAITINNASLGIYGASVANNGTISLAYYASLVGQSASTAITGSGTIVLDNSAGPAQLYGAGANQLTIGAGQTVQGRGDIGIGQGAITNNGVINANVGSASLNLDARGGSGGNTDGSGLGAYNAGFVNTNLLEATAGGTLYFGGGAYDNSGGTIRAVGSGSTVVFGDDSSIVGGNLTSSGGGTISENGNGTQYLTDVALTGSSSLTINNDNVRIGNTFTNNGAVKLTYYGYLIGNSATGNTINGTGTITLDDTSGPARLYGDGANKLTIGGGQLVQGSGEIGINSGAITSNGVINANVAGRTISIDARGGSAGNGDGSGVGTGNSYGFANNNLLEATNGGTLYLASGTYQNSATAVIQAVGTNSVVTLGDDSSIVGGKLTSSGGGVISENNNGTQYLTDVALTNGSVFNIRNDNIRIGNNFTNNGSINLSYYGFLIGNSATGNTINGTGTITLDSTEGPARLYGDGANKLTIGSGQVVQGRGDIGINSGAITNNGVINANVMGGGISLDARGNSGGNTDGTGLGTYNAGFVNTNLLEATNGATLSFASGVYDNRNATIQAVGNGSTIVLGDDSSIVGGNLTTSGGATINENNNGTQYITDVTLTNGSTFNIVNDSVRIGNNFTNNGAISLSYYGSLIGNSAAGNTINGTGTITLDNSAAPARLYGEGANVLTIGNGQTVRGSGEIGINQGAIVNGGNILADGAITIDARGGGSGNSDLTGVGTGSLAGFYNAAGGQVQANNGGATLTLASGLYEQAAGGSFSVGAGSNFNMADDSNLANLKAGGVLDKGLYFAFANGTMNLRSDQTGSIVTIGTNHAGTDTVVTLSGPGSVIEVTPRGGGTATTIDQSLQSVAQSGRLVIADGRSFTTQNGAFTNAGTTALSNGATFSAPAGFTNTATGTVTGNGTFASPITNSGTVVADGGTLFAQAITGTTGTIASNAGATLSLAGAGGPSTAGFLVNNGALALGSNNVTVTSDYQNANFGSGNGFNAHANVSGSGLILAASATMDLSGPGLSNNTLNVGNVRLGNSSSTTLTITNNGTLTTLRGAVESPTTNTVNISSSNFVVGPNGGSTQVQLSYTGNTAGSLTGQTVTVANNFDNVADRTLTIQGAAYNPAAASLSPNPINLGAARTNGTLSGTVTITNTAPGGAYSEKLAVTGATGSGGASGTAPGGLINPQASAGSTVSLDTTTSGTKSGSVVYHLATDGTGTSGLAQMALPDQSVTVNGKVYQVAVAQLGTTNVTFATVRQGATPAPAALVSVKNAASGMLTDSLNASVGTTTGNVSSTAAPGPLAAGQSGNLGFTESTATAGQFSGSSQVNFTSTDPDLAPMNLPSQTISFAGTVTQMAVAQIVKDAGAGAFAGMGTAYTLDLGTLMAGTSVSTDLGVLNAIPNSAYAETLGGMFGASGGMGYTFAGMTFSGLTGGSTDMGNLLTFNTAGLGDGTYTDLLTFSGYTRYAGLNDLSLAPIQVSVTARITGSGTVNPPPPPPPGAVPEPATWTTMLLGFGAIGAALRRRRAPVRAR